MNIKRYQPRTTKVTAIQMEDVPKRLNMTSNVYNYKGVEFVSNAMPVVGDFLIEARKGHTFMSNAKFISAYVEINDG